MSHPTPQSQPAPTKRDFWTWNLSTRFLFWSSLLFLCTLVGILYSTLWGLPWTQLHGRVGQLRTEMFRQLSWAADLHQEMIENWLADKQKDVRVSAQGLRLQARAGESLSVPDIQQIQAYLQTVAQAYPEFDHVEMLDTTNQVRFSSDLLSSNSFTRDNFFQHAILSGRGYIGRATIQKGKEWPLFRVSYPIRDRDDQVMALLVATVSPGSLLKQLLNTGESLGESGEVLLVNDQVLLLSPLKYSLPDGTQPQPMQFQITAKPAVFAAAGHEGLVEAEELGIHFV